MKFVTRFILAFLIFSLTFDREGHAALNSGDAATPLYVQSFDVSDQATRPRGITFNNDGSKMYIVGQDSDKVHEYNLSINFNVSTASFVHSFSVSSQENVPSSVKFNNDGTKMFIVGTQRSRVHEYILSTAFNISTASHESFVSVKSEEDCAWALDFNNDGTKMFITGCTGAGANNEDINEYSLNVGFDLSEGVNFIQLKKLSDISLVTEWEPYGIEFNPDGTTMFIIGTGGNDVNQYSLSTAFDISTISFVGGLHLHAENANPSGIAFSKSGLKMFITGDVGDDVDEYHLKCPFNLFVGKCSSFITQDSDRTGMAEAQIEVTKRTIKHAANTALNRLKWIRRNKDKQNLSNQNVKLNFSNSQFHLLKKYQHAFISKSTTSKNNTNSNKNYFYWSEGDISLGRVGDTSIASTKDVKTNSLTFGLDKFTDDYGISGFAFRYGSDDVDVGTAGSNLDSNTYNITYYSTSPIENDTKYLDKIFGIGKIKSDILTVLDGNNLTADRTGNQIYGTLKIKDEYKLDLVYDAAGRKDNITLIPSGQFDFGHTILNGYKEAGTGAIEVEDQHIRTKNLRVTLALVEDLSNDKYTYRRHGKLEYMAELDRSSNFKYTYVEDGSVMFNDTLHTGSLHNLNGEIGVDIIFPEHYSVFIIYERNHAFGTGYSDNLYIALGYLPHEDTEYAFTINGSENLMSKFEIKKNINGYNLSLNLIDDLINLGDSKEASITLNKIF